MKNTVLVFSSLNECFRKVSFRNIKYRMMPVILAAVILPAIDAHADWEKTNYFTASDLSGYLWFPASVAIDQDIIVAGSPYKNDKGAAYVFNAQTGHELHTLTASDGEEDDYFGEAVAISEDTIVVGAPGEDDNGIYSGSAYVFDATTGNQIHKLKASDGATDESFGQSVAVSGNFIVVSAPFHQWNTSSDASNSGAVYVYDITTGNQIFKLTGTEMASVFGHSVAIHEDRIVIGSLEDGGTVYVFDGTNGNLIYTLSPYHGYDGDSFGWSVAMNNDLVVVGAPRPGFGDNEINTFGSVFVFDAATGNEIHKFIPEDGCAWCGFGTSVAVSNSTIVIGAENSVYIFDAISGNEVNKIIDIDGTPSYFGKPLDISDDRIVVGHTLVRSLYVYENEAESIEGIDFETIPPGNYPALSIDGYDFSPTWNSHIKIYDDGQTTSIAPFWNDSLQLERSNGLPFDLQSLDYIGRWPGVSSHAEITGTLSDGSTVHAQVDYDASVWNTKVLDWKDLIHVSIYTPGGRLQMDNFIFSEVTLSGTTLNFEDQAVGEYASVAESGYELMPLKRDTVSIYSDNGDQSITPYWNDTLRLIRQDGGSDVVC